MEYTIYCCFPHTRGKFTGVQIAYEAALGFPHTRGKFTDHGMTDIEMKTDFTADLFILLINKFDNLNKENVFKGMV